MRLYDIAALGGILIAGTVHAQSIDPCPLALPCPGDAADLYLQNILINGAKGAFGGVLVAMLIFYGFKLIVGADNDSTVGEVYNAYAHAAIGSVLALGAFALANTFAVPGQVVNATPGNIVLISVASTFKALLATALLFNISYQGYRLVTSQDESQSEKAKKQFLYGMTGAVIVILAGYGVDSFAGRDIGIISREAIGIANFLGTILGAFAFIAMFVAGIFLVISVDEQYKDRAKKVMMTALIVLGVTIMSAALVQFAFNAPQ